MEIGSACCKEKKMVISILNGIGITEGALQRLATMCQQYFLRKSRNTDAIIEKLVKLGYFIEKEDDEGHHIHDFRNKYNNLIKARTKKLSKEEKPRVWLVPDSGGKCAYCAKSYAHQMLDISGGKNIFADVPEVMIEINPEEVTTRNPDIIIRYFHGEDAGDASKIKTLWEDMMNRPDLANLNAVKTGRIYVIDQNLQYGLYYPVAVAYWAKWMHPSLLHDLTPLAIHEEFQTKFGALDYNLYKQGIFVYHPEQHPEGK